MWWKTVIGCGGTLVRRTGAGNAIFPGTAVLLTELSTPLQHLSNMVPLQQVRAQQSQGEFLSSVSIYLTETAENLVIQLVITLQLLHAILLHCTTLNLTVFSEVTLIFTVPRQYHAVSLLLISSVPSELLWTHTSHQSLARVSCCFFFKVCPIYLAEIPNPFIQLIWKSQTQKASVLL